MTTLTVKLRVTIDGKRHLVANVAEASALHCQIRDAKGHTMRTMRDSTIFTMNGKFLARISYNGVVWAERVWTPKAVPLYRPAAGGQANG